jgi:hypothetical protein
MQMAIDKDGKRFAAHNAVKGVEYRCPMCRKKVNVCQGEIKEPYFAHQKNDACTDDWVYDMSEWHCAMQSRFPEMQREILVTHEGKTHRADILFEKRIIEFQHSDISIKEIRERNEFYNAAGYEVAWVFDLQEQYDAGRILPDDNLNGLGYKWLYPKSCLQCFPRPKDILTELVLYFYWVNSDGYEEFNKVIWSSHEGGVPDFRRFVVADYDNIGAKDATSPLVVNSFFTSRKDQLALRLAELKCRYTIKYSGFKGHPRTDYICPRRPDEFGIKRYGEQACAYCRYCAAVKNYGKNFEAYCCYPSQVNEVDELHPGYESSGVPEY